MRVLLLCSALATALQETPARLSLPLESARDATGEGIAFVETEIPAAEAFVEQRIEVVFRFGLETELARTRLVQPFGTALDVPVQLVAPGLLDAAGSQTASGGAHPSFAFNEAIDHATRLEDRVVGEHRFEVYEARKRARAVSAGELAIAAPVLAFACATRFEETFVGGRVAADRVDAFVSGNETKIEVRPLPEEGRPAEFGGAVGSFTVRAEVEPREIAAGESVKLRLVIEGDGNLETFEAPRWKDVGGFRVLGVIDEKSATARKLTYSLEPVSEKVWQVPAVTFAYFEPQAPAGYRVARTEPVEVKVKAGSGPAAQPEDDRAGARPVRWAWASGIVASLVVLVALVRRRK